MSSYRSHRKWEKALLLSPTTQVQCLPCQCELLTSPVDTYSVQLLKSNVFHVSVSYSHLLWTLTQSTYSMSSMSVWVTHISCGLLLSPTTQVQCLPCQCELLTPPVDSYSVHLLNVFHVSVSYSHLLWTLTQSTYSMSSMSVWVTHISCGLLLSPPTQCLPCKCELLTSPVDSYSVHLLNVFHVSVSYSHLLWTLTQSTYSMSSTSVWVTHTSCGLLLSPPTQCLPCQCELLTSPVDSYSVHLLNVFHVSVSYSHLLWALTQSTYSMYSMSVWVTHISCGLLLSPPTQCLPCQCELLTPPLDSYSVQLLNVFHVSVRYSHLLWALTQSTYSMSSTSVWVTHTSCGLLLSPPTQCLPRQCELLTSPVDSYSVLLLNVFHVSVSFSHLLWTLTQSTYSMSSTSVWVTHTSCGLLLSPPTQCLPRQCELLTSPVDSYSVHLLNVFHVSVSYSHLLWTLTQSTYSMSSMSVWVTHTSCGLLLSPTTQCLPRQCELLTPPVDSYSVHLLNVFHVSMSYSHLLWTLTQSTYSMSSTSVWVTHISCGLLLRPTTQCLPCQCELLTSPVDSYSDQLLNVFHVSVSYWHLLWTLTQTNYSMFSTSVWVTHISCGLLLSPTTQCLPRQCELLTPPVDSYSVHLLNVFHVSVSYSHLLWTLTQSTYSMSSMSVWVTHISCGLLLSPPTQCLPCQCELLTPPVDSYSVHLLNVFHVSVSYSHLLWTLTQSNYSMSSTSVWVTHISCGLSLSPTTQCLPCQCELLTPPVDSYSVLLLNVFHVSVSYSHLLWTLTQSTYSMSSMSVWVTHISYGLLLSPPTQCLPRQCELLTPPVDSYSVHLLNVFHVSVSYSHLLWTLTQTDYSMSSTSVWVTHTSCGLLLSPTTQCLPCQCELLTSPVDSYSVLLLNVFHVSVSYLHLLWTLTQSYYSMFSTSVWVTHISCGLLLRPTTQCFPRQCELLTSPVDSYSDRLLNVFHVSVSYSHLLWTLTQTDYSLPSTSVWVTHISYGPSTVILASALNTRQLD